jgi:integrase
MRQHPTYSSLDLSWFKPFLESLPIEAESERRMRKEKKYLEYAVVETIPAKIHAERLSASANQESQAARLAMEELLLTWLLVLPWRQRNIRECRIGGPRPNLFRAKIPNRSIDMQAWVRNEAQKNPEAEFWQLHFVPKETKTGREIRAFVPRQLIGPLEEYLTQFRPQLLKQSDPGTLFLTKDGTSMTRGNVYNLITRLTSRHGGRSVNPHLFRDIVAFAWLKEHPKDYLTLSKILWHANINVTIRTYGSQFDESSGICAMEAWLEERESRSKTK